MHVSRQRVSRWYPYGAVNSFPSLFVLSKFPLNDNQKTRQGFFPPIINNTENSNFEHVTILIIGRSSISSILLANLSRYFLRPFDRLIISRNFDHARLLRFSSGWGKGNNREETKALCERGTPNIGKRGPIERRREGIGETMRRCNLAGL